MTPKARLAAWTVAAGMAALSPLWLLAPVPEPVQVMVVWNLGWLVVVGLLLATTPPDAIRLKPRTSDAIILDVAFAPLVVIALQGAWITAVIAGLILGMFHFGLRETRADGSAMSPWWGTLVLWQPIAWANVANAGVVMVFGIAPTLRFAGFVAFLVLLILAPRSRLFVVAAALLEAGWTLYNVF